VFRYKLRVELIPLENTSLFFVAEYCTFRVNSEKTNYLLHVQNYTGNVSVDAFGHHDGLMFTTKDAGNDGDPTQNCAAPAAGGFWYFSKWCGHYRVNSLYYYTWYNISNSLTDNLFLWTSRMVLVHR